jgi:hypothetical protein
MRRKGRVVIDWERAFQLELGFMARARKVSDASQAVSWVPQDMVI